MFVFSTLFARLFQPLRTIQASQVINDGSFHVVTEIAFRFEPVLHHYEEIYSTFYCKIFEKLKLMFKTFPKQSLRVKFVHDKNNKLIDMEICSRNDRQ